MADRGDTHYHLPRLNLWFAASSLLLLVASLWMVIDDWKRSWKDYQRDFFELEIARARAALEEPEARAAAEREQELAQELAAVEEDLARKSAAIAEAEKQLFQLRGDLFVASEAEKSAKQEYNWARFEYEERLIGKAELDEKERVLLEASKALELVEAEVNAQETLVKGFYADRDAVERNLKSAAKDVDLVRKKLAKLDPKDWPTRIAETIRDFPGLDFIGPNITVKKVVLSDLTFELNFTQKPRIDMCQSCHMSIDLPGYEGVGQPFESHPRLDLFLSAKSPHPLNSFGCTICHRGSGESLHFVRADHRPSDAEEAMRWEDEYHWHKQHHWDYPMLSSEYVEASCVQCHKSSMELIAREAPRVTEGYQLFERYGCYACHKVDWFPTKRRPGPSLKHVTDKTNEAFIASWIADPRGFRPTTWMPQFFHLENWPDDEVVVESSAWGTGPPIVGQAWNDTAVAAITSFLGDRAGPAPDWTLPDDLVGDPVRGREVFTISGCLACHNVAPFAGEAESTNLALHKSGENEHGPNLRGVATKITPEWLFHWIKDPSSYWSETRMPDLDLPDQDVLDVVAYVFEDPDGWFHDVPDGWTAAAVPYDRAALEEQARWYFGNRTRAQFAKAFANEWKDDGDLLVAVGERLVLSHGCHSCHEISGLEDQMPIGTELSTWGSKTVDKLDFGFIPEVLAQQHGWSHHQTEEFKKFREGWIEQKLSAPRSYDRPLPPENGDRGDAVRVKNPVERLKMPWFDLDEHEIQAISTFVVGQVKDEVQRARMVPTAGQARMDEGLRTIRQQNCAACHVIEPGEITFTDSEGERRTVAGQFFPLSDDEYVAPPVDERFHAFVDDWERAYEEQLEEVVIELLRPEPGLGGVGESVVVEGPENVQGIEIAPQWGGDFVQLVVDYYRNVWDYDEENDEDVSRTADPEGQGKVQDVDGAWRDYSTEPYVKVRWTFAPPFLIGEGYKLQRDWFHQFLMDPYPLREQMRVKMPKFHWTGDEAGAIADYFAQAALRDYPVRYVRRALAERGTTPAQAAAEAQDAGATGVTAEAIESIAAGSRPSIESSFPRLAAWLAGTGFEMAPPVDPNYEAVVPRTPSVLKATLEAHPDFWEAMGELTGSNAVNCFQCHWLNGAPPNAEGPIAWAPDLRNVRDRLRPDWVREWMHAPSKIYPGTAMPANFEGDQYQDIWPKPGPEQIEDVLIWLFNLDRAPAR